MSIVTVAPLDARDAINIRKLSAWQHLNMFLFRSSTASAYKMCSGGGANYPLTYILLSCW
jgi:hypothetical protein